MLTSEQLRTRNYRIREIQAPGFPIDHLPLEWQARLAGNFAFEFEGPGWNTSQALVERSDRAGTDFIQTLQQTYDFEGEAGVRRFVEEQREAERAAR